ncbi:hypothetical protein CEXT_716581 [Caerostris extrusa]|uniref:Uncharacterized protein n=1 Tax=Caerostris extrusa TaxID=172846 RepID=A0AAV4VWS2_CAEEX|nr:hypothetical protein CEXT_716581 [Caerostris extrusa]
MPKNCCEGVNQEVARSKLQRSCLGAQYPECRLIIRLGQVANDFNIFFQAIPLCSLWITSFYDDLFTVYISALISVRWFTTIARAAVFEKGISQWTLVDHTDTRVV